LTDPSPGTPHEAPTETPAEPPASRAAAELGLGARVVATTIPSSAEESASLQGIDVERLLRTIVVRRAADDYVFVLVPGGRQIAWERLRSHLGERRLSLPDATRPAARPATSAARSPRSRRPRPGPSSPTPRSRVAARSRSAPAPVG
jgi:hypothetical protein